ncbi:MAG TPA: DinB family protein [Candidatus Acidoferrales bacterium]|nr:DinB family protein [Candidatus Acidoferrales bacterium]
MEPRLTLPPILSRAPSLVEAIIEGFEPDTLDWQPNGQRWSATMVIAHLAESEVNCFRLRLSRTAMEQEPILEPYDQWAQFRDQPVLSAREALRKWTSEREKTVRLLRSLPAGVIARQCSHQELGRLTFGELLNEFAFHDMGHLRQILELCRSRAYYPQMGGWRQYYRVSP